MNNIDVFKGASGFDSHVIYEPAGIDNTNVYFEGKNALRECKKWAKEKGFTHITVITSKMNKTIEL